MKLIRLPRSQIKLGRPLPWNVRDETSRLLLSRGHIVEDAHLLDELVTRGVYVELEEARAVAREEAPAERENLAVSALKRPPSRFTLWGESAETMRRLVAEVPRMPLQLDRLADFATWLTDLIDQDSDMAIYHMVRQEGSDSFYYGYNHAIHAATLCLLMARHLGWPRARTMSLMLAALTMNLPILHLQGQMAAQEDPMSPGQKTLIRQHPQQAHEWLLKWGVTDQDWLTAVLQHHEHPDGKGYPAGLTEVADIAVALRVADVLTAKISQRKLHPALTFQDAAKQLYQEDHGGPLSHAIIKECGLFPPGDLVRLASGEVAVVMRRTAHAKCPIVAAITDEAGRPMVHTTRRDTSQQVYAIVGSVADKTLVAHLPPERIYGHDKAGSASIHGHESHPAG